ncbi:hypothetical protein K9V56_014915 [Paucibacter aquatile]|nr:hypothetical protein [Paucibacter aquatile]WIW00320.1 hypothetical protein K9V56_014915 [Paucibacter aquatile]
MDQITVGFEPQPKKTRQEVLLGEMSQVALWSALVTLTQLHSLTRRASGAGRSRRCCLSAAFNSGGI